MENIIEENNKNENINNNPRASQLQEDSNVEGNEPETKVEKEKKEIVGNFGEIISRSLIEKLISYVVVNKYILEVEKKVGDHCFIFIKDQIKPLLEVGFLSHEIEKNKETDVSVNKEGSLQQEPQLILKEEKIELFYDNPDYDYENTWLEIPEPPIQEIDRNAGTQIKLVKSNPTDEQDENIHNNQSSNNDYPGTSMTVITSEGNVRESMPHEKFNNKLSSSSIKKSKKKIMSSSSVSSRDTDKKKEEIKAFQAQLKLKMSNKQKMAEIQNESDENKPDNNPIIDLPSYDIPESKFYNKYLENEKTLDLDNLRREREIEIKRKEEEQKLQIEKEKRERYNMLLANRPKKEFDGERYTFDPNGKIIPIKPPTMDLLASEFWWSQPHIKDRGSKKCPVKIIGKRNSIRQSMKQEEDSVPYISTKSRSSRNVTLINSIGNKDNKENSPPRARNSIANLDKRTSFLDNPSTKRRSVQKEDIIYNVNPTDIYNWKTPKHKDVPIVISGENFSLFKPEIGVVITSNENNKKEGGMEFSRQFKKPSMNEFSQMAYESNRLNSLRYLSSLSIDSTNQNDYNSYLGYHKHFGTDTNPLIQNAQTIISPKNYLEKEKSILPSLYNSSNIKGYNSEFLDSMKLTSPEIQNIKSVLEDTELEKEKEQINMNYMKLKNKEGTKNINNANLFNKLNKRKISIGRDKIRNNEKMHLNMVDKFNSQIITDKVWGDISNQLFMGANSNVSKKKFKKPSKLTNIKEMGYQISMTKMPRDRRLLNSISYK